MDDYILKNLTNINTNTPKHHDSNIDNASFYFNSCNSV